jgi:hypothetical protein
LHHLASKNLAEKKYGSQIYVDDGIPIFKEEIDRWGATLYACVIDQDIDVSKGGERDIQGLFRRCFSGDIERQRKETSACTGDPLC